MLTGESMTQPDNGSMADLVQGMQARAAQFQGTPFVIGDAAAKPDRADELTKLADLRDRGALSPAESDAQKAKLLAAG